MEPSREQEEELKKLALRMASASRWAVVEAAFKLGLRLGREERQKWQGQ